MSYVEHLGTSRHYVILYKLPKKYLFLFEPLGTPIRLLYTSPRSVQGGDGNGDGGGGDISAGADGGGNGDGGGGGLGVADNRKGGASLGMWPAGPQTHFNY